MATQCAASSRASSTPPAPRPTANTSATTALTSSPAASANSASKSHTGSSNAAPATSLSSAAPAFPTAPNGTQSPLILESANAAAKKIAAVRALESRGAQIRILRADITNQDQLTQIFAALPAEKLAGIIHAAAHLGAALTKDLTRETLEEMLRPKVQGTWLLHRLTEKLDLDFFVLFSSSTSLLGSRDLGHYAAANQFLDAFAHYRRARGLPAVAINWGAWEAMGSTSDADREKFLRGGLRTMDDATATRVLEEIAFSDATHLFAGAFDWKIIKSLYEARGDRPLLEKLSADDGAAPPLRLHPPVRLATASATPPPASPNRKLSSTLSAPPPPRSATPSSPTTSFEPWPPPSPSTPPRSPSPSPSPTLASTPSWPSNAKTASRPTWASPFPLSAFSKAHPSTNSPRSFSSSFPKISAPAQRHRPPPHPAQPQMLAPHRNSRPRQRISSQLWPARPMVRLSIHARLIHLQRGFHRQSHSRRVSREIHAALQKLVARHPALRTIFGTTDDGRPVQRVLPAAPPDLQIIDAANFSEAQLRDAVLRDFQRPFVLDRPLLRVTLYRRAGHDVMLLNVHHLVIDAWSLRVCFEDLKEIYSAEMSAGANGQRDATRKNPARLEPLKGHYSDFVSWQAALVENSAADSEWNYWKEQLSGELPLLSLPSSKPRPTVLVAQGECLPLNFSSGLPAKVAQAAKDARVTNYAFLLAVFDVLLHLYTGQDDIIVGTSATGRETRGWTNVVGYFVNLLPLRADLSGDPTFAEHLTRTKKVILGALQHQDFPFSLLVERLRLRRTLDRSPVFQAFFNFLTDRNGELGPLFMGVGDCAIPFGNSVLSPSVIIPQQEGQSEIVLQLAEVEGELVGNLNYNSLILDRPTADAMALAFSNLLETVLADPQIRLSEISQDGTPFSLLLRPRRNPLLVCL